MLLAMAPHSTLLRVDVQAAGPYQPNRGLDLLASASARRVVLKQARVLFMPCSKHWPQSDGIRLSQTSAASRNL